MMNLDKFLDDFNRRAGVTPAKNVSKPKVESKKTVKPASRKEYKKPIQSNINEEFIEKSLTYTSVVLKSIRETFNDEKRKIIYESLYNSLGQLLNRDSIEYIHVEQEEIVTNKKVVKEDVKYNIDESKSVGYSRDMGIETLNGEVDLSSVSVKDINDFKELAGV